MPGLLQKSALQAETGSLELDGESLIGVIVDTGYTFSSAHDYANDVTAHEVTPASTESRLTGVAANTLMDGATGWLVTITGTVARNLSDVSNRGGIVWCRPGGSDALRAIVGFCADIGGADGAYLPTWPDGLFVDEIRPVDLEFTAPLVETDGVVALSPTGIPDGSKFLRDDGTWATPAGSSGTVTSVAGVDPVSGDVHGEALAAALSTLLPPSGQIGTEDLSPADGDTVTISSTKVSRVTMPVTGSVTLVWPSGGPVVHTILYPGSGQKLYDQGLDTGADPFGVVHTVDQPAVVIGNRDSRVALPYYAWTPPSGSGDMLAANNLSDVASASTSRTNLGLGSAATHAHSDYDAAGAAAAVTATSIGAVPTARTLAGLDLSSDRSASALRTALALVPGTDVQAYDADLAAVAALATDAFGLALLTKTSSSAVRTYLGLVLGTDVQAYSANLAAIAGLTTAADRLTYWTGSGAAALATFTAFGRTLVATADAAAGRTALGLGTLATASTITSADITDGTITNADLANMANKTFRGRHTAGTGVPEDVSVANVMADLSGAAAADFSLNTHKVTAVSYGTASDDAATYGQVLPAFIAPMVVNDWIGPPSLPTGVGGTLGSTLSSNILRVYFCPIWVPQDCTVDQIACYQNVAATDTGMTGELALTAMASHPIRATSLKFSASGSGATLSGTFSATAAAGQRVISLGAAATLTRGLYWGLLKLSASTSAGTNPQFVQLASTGPLAIPMPTAPAANFSSAFCGYGTGPTGTGAVPANPSSSLTAVASSGTNLPWIALRIASIL